MRIWWCEEHEAMSVLVTSECSTATWSPELITNCRMVEKQLVSVDALVVPRDAELSERIETAIRTNNHKDRAAAVLAVLVGEPG